MVKSGLPITKVTRDEVRRRCIKWGLTYDGYCKLANKLIDEVMKK